MGSGIPCTVFVSEQSEHATQLFTGLRLLHARGAIDLTLKYVAPPSWPCAAPRLSRHRSLVRVLLDRGQLVYDLDDSPRFSLEAVEWGCLTFKRMLSSKEERARLLPYGPNYPVVLDEAAGALDSWRDVPRLSRLTPNPAPGEGVLFLTRLWDPAEVSAWPDDITRMNTLRIALTASLRQAFGNRVLAGIADGRFARTACPPEYLVGRETSQKAAYLMQVSRASVVITTNGLHDSVGWRFGEAVALGRPVVTEAFDCVMPGDPKRHPWRSFSTIDECLGLVEDLLRCEDRRRDAREDARRYYRDCLAPDALVARTLECALQVS